MKKCETLKNTVFPGFLCTSGTKRDERDLYGSQLLTAYICFKHDGVRDMQVIMVIVLFSSSQDPGF